MGIYDPCEELKIGRLSEIGIRQPFFAPCAAPFY